ncbi:MAG: hypothetical protein GTO63_26415 [Anaerolineae bacterium]|nr:hypothetical protein [Anaerolineae bacterium]NIN98270.1 hypothetical protein [Anaerolineae bacterium]NIQ81199.1 hypothetical protein [Anaerolineae bacterium]
MTLERYSRPQNDTGFGFHYFPDTQHYSPQDIKQWVPELKSMGASWLVVLSRLGGPIPEFFVKELIANEIEPVVRVSTPAVEPIDRSSLGELLGAYAGWGVNYVEVLGEANVASRWHPQDWCQLSLVQRFVDVLVPCLEEMQAAGLHPVFPALRPPGSYWDLSFLQTALQLLTSKVEASLFERMGVGMHNHAWDKSLSWGQGGRKRWPAARPYFSPGESQDHIGFNLFEWYDEIIKATVGASLGLVCMGSGTVGDPYSPVNGVWTDEKRHADRAVSIAGMMMDGSIPEYVVNHTFWLLATDEGHPSRVHAWHGPDGKECQAASAVKGMLKHPRSIDGQDPGPVSPTPPPDSVGDVEFIGLSQEMIDTLRISGPQNESEPYWKVVRVEVQPGTGNMSAFAIVDAETVRFSWPDGEYVVGPKDDPYAPPGARHQAASMPMFAGWGGYSVEVVGNSERLSGFGLYGDNLELNGIQHHPVLVTFVQAGPGAEDSPLGPPTPAPAPEPAPQRSVKYSDFPRPPGDNGMGIHLGLNTTDEAMSLDIRRAKDMKLTWATLCYEGEGQLLRCAKMIWDAGIMPVCRQITEINRTYPFDRDARVLIEHGIPAYLQIFNEPSDPREWRRERPKDYVQKWAGLWAQKAIDVYNAGGYPGLQCLQPEELEAAIHALGPDSQVWERVWFCAHNYGLNHPPDWQEDPWCVLGYTFFADVFERRLGFVPPIICGEGGWLYGAYDDHRYPRVDGMVHARYTRTMFEWFRHGELSNGETLPEYLFAACPWILSGPSDEAWYGFTTKVLTIQSVKDISGFVRASTASQGTS